MTGTDKPHGTLLGEPTEYRSEYDATLLQPIPRQQSRATLGIETEKLPFKGVDIWTAYEVSWLDNSGKPQVAVADFEFPANSPAIVESKSFKLYLNSFNQTRFSSVHSVVEVLEQDLSAAAGAPVMVGLHTLHSATQRGLGHFAGESIDQEAVTIDCYSPNPELLRLNKPERFVTETLYSDLLKTNCPVTGQPDWGSVMIHYRGAEINRGSLLKYIVSFRQHQDFHEHCVERMFMDIRQYCQTAKLTVYARYTRRGGLDINPYRSDMPDDPESVRLVRLARQ
ncbi:NADPH-dependent 7-cyano-7-deazaguanine reductase QueF [Pseudomaricurvus alcaniphilus]|uniref:NADPH-dependent 7-cyano-7-deazaguanine reductase QueF n=1 Tax=Pseudomaricurvus alcaniphilus TaxID=1166482 RepID=UPI0014086390|nr:NADPH-dependent 7-cyano-7-deazaguanine reductase QueF [Pseudomaricurvus alcaniphilus]NHN36261.1 NADPH-dependent 7-cyano-7-deazaguanine reductase QueF [Pseudomaricurvus alcaniphilus]